MSKQCYHPEFFKQTRADGTEYFFAEVTVKEKWFFGLLTASDRLYVCNGVENAYLGRFDVLQNAFKTFSDAETAALLAIAKHKAVALHGEIVYYSKVQKHKSLMKTSEEIIDKIDEMIEKPFVSAKFGDNWREHQKRMINDGQVTVDQIINVAWKQGRRALMLEKAIEEIYNSNAKDEN